MGKKSRIVVSLDAQLAEELRQMKERVDEAAFNWESRVERLREALFKIAGAKTVGELDYQAMVTAMRTIARDALREDGQT